MKSEHAETSPHNSIAKGVLDSLAAEAKDRLAVAELITHAGERGRARESILATFLRQIVPAGFDIETGFVIDTTGGQSLQQDLIVVRHEYHPVFQVGGVKFFPVEAVAAVIEVKSSLDGKTLDDALRNSASVKRLDRTAGGRNYRLIGGAGGYPVPDLDADIHEHQILSLIVAAKSNATAQTLCNHVLDHLATEKRRVWPNFISIAGELSIGYDAGKRSDQMSAKGLRCFDPHMESGNLEPLVDLAVELWSFLRVTALVDVRPFAYVQGSMTGATMPFHFDH